MFITGVYGGDLPTGILYDEAWDETAELLVNNEVKEGEVGKSEIRGVRIRSNEVEGGKAGKSEVEDCVIGSNKKEERGTEGNEEGNEMEESDHFETVTKYWETPYFSCKYDQIPTTNNSDHSSCYLYMYAPQ